MTVYIRDKERRIVGVGHTTAELLLCRPGVCRIDVRPHEHGCQMGATWEDGATAAWDVPLPHEAVLAKVKSLGLGLLDLVFLH